MTRICFLPLLLMATISCRDEDRDSLTADDIEAEIIEMNWYTSVKDLYIPEVLESSLREPQTHQSTGYRKDRAGDRIP
jgi:hypothetical protein